MVEPRRGQAALSAALAAALVALGGCLPDDGAPDDAAGTPASPPSVTAPPGFSVERVAGVSLARADEWTVTDAGEVPGAALVVRPPDAAGPYPPQAVVYVDQGFDGTLEEYRFTFNAESSTALPGREVVGEAPVPIPGAEGAFIIEAEYPLPGDPEILIRQLDLLVVAPDGTTADVRASARADEFEALRTTFTTMLESVTIHPEDASA